MKEDPTHGHDTNYCDDDDRDYDSLDADDDEDYFDCHRGKDGSCGLAGTEECDWECPYSR
jgi:hypothetical protein